MHVWIVGRIVGGYLFSPVWLPGRWQHFAPLRPVIPDLTANPSRKIIMDTALHQRVTKTAMGRLIGHRCKESGSQHSMKSSRS